MHVEGSSLVKHVLSFKHIENGQSFKTHIETQGRPLHPPEIERFVQGLEAARKGLQPEGHEPWSAGDVFESAGPQHKAVVPRFVTEGSQAGAQAQELVPSRQVASRLSRAMGTLGRGGQALYGGGKYVLGQGANAVRYAGRQGWRASASVLRFAVEHPWEAAGLLVSAGQGWKQVVNHGRGANPVISAFKLVSSGEEGLNPLHEAASGLTGAAAAALANPKRGQAALQRLKHIVLPHTRPLSTTLQSKAWEAGKFVAGKASSVADKAVEDPVRTAGAALLGGKSLQFLIGRGGKAGAAAAGYILTAIEMLYEPARHLNLWTHRMPGGHRRRRHF